MLDVPSPSSGSTFFLYLPKNPQERLRSNEPLSRATPCEFVGGFIPSHSMTMTRPSSTTPFLDTERISESDFGTSLMWIVTCELLLLLVAVKASSITLVFFFWLLFMHCSEAYLYGFHFATYG